LAGGDDCGDSSLLEMGPKVQNQNESRFDILCYTSKLFEVDSVFIGNAFLEFFCETADETSQWFSRICLVNKNNQSINLFDSIITMNNLDNLNKVKMDFGPISFCVKKGEKIRIQITNGGFPRWESLRDSLGNLVVQNSTILHNLNYPSRLILPIAI
jgi:predicted acyl esterase